MQLLNQSMFVSFLNSKFQYRGTTARICKVPDETFCKYNPCVHFCCPNYMYYNATLGMVSNKMSIVTIFGQSASIDLNFEFFLKKNPTSFNIGSFLGPFMKKS